MANLQVRLARPPDYAAVEQLCAERPYYDSLFMPAHELRQFSLQHLQANLDKLQSTREAHLVVVSQYEQLVAYAVLLLHTVETITQESQVLMFDWFAPNFEVLAAMLEECVERTRQAGDAYLVVHLQEAAKREQMWFYRLGFRPELNRVVRRIAPGHVGPSSPRYRARKARPNEHLFITRVNAVYSACYRPAGRDTDLQTVRANFLSAYVALNFEDPHAHYIILDEVETGLPTGYIILTEHELPMSAGLAFYTYDVAVAPEFAGRGLSLYLCGAAESLAGQRGGALLFGDTSLDNVAAVNGDRQLGFQIDSKRWGLRM